MSISKATLEAISEYPYIEPYLSRKLVNYRALAREIRPQVALKLGREVNIQSIVSALRRLPLEERDREKPIGQILSRSDINLRYDLGLVTVSLSGDTHSKVLEVHSELGGEGYLLLQGQENLTIVAKDSYLSFLQELFKGSTVRKLGGLAGVVVKSPEAIAVTPGVIARLASLLSMEKINIVEMMSSHVETFFLIEEEDALRCILTIRREMRRAREG